MRRELDADARRVHDALMAQLPPFETLEPTEARDLLRRAREARPVVGEPVAAVREEQLEGPGGPLTVRVYHPAPDEVRPVILFFHGGGWVVGDLESHDPMSRRLANGTGAVVVSVDYRLAPEHPFPAAFDDARAALAWTVRHAAHLGADPTRLAVFGDSAGGNLAAALCQAARRDGGPSIALQVLVYPVLDHRFDSPSYVEHGTGYLPSVLTMRWFWRHYLPAPHLGSSPFASPARAGSLAGLPPAIVVTAGCDPLCSEGQAYAARLQEEGNGAELLHHPGAFHGFYDLVGLVESATRANQMVHEYTRKILG